MAKTKQREKAHRVVYFTEVARETLHRGNIGPVLSGKVRQGGWSWARLSSPSGIQVWNKTEEVWLLPEVQIAPKLHVYEIYGRGLLLLNS